MKRLRDWFDVTKVKQAQFAEWLAVSQPTVSDWVQGETNPSFDKLGDISSRTGIPIELLVADCAENVRTRKQKQTAA